MCAQLCTTKGQAGQETQDPRGFSAVKPGARDSWGYGAPYWACGGDPALRRPLLHGTLCSQDPRAPLSLWPAHRAGPQGPELKTI